MSTDPNPETDVANMSDTVRLLDALRNAPDAVHAAICAQFADVVPLEDFQRQTAHIYPSLARIRRHVALRHENGLARYGAVIEREGHPLLVRPSRWHRWLVSND